MVHVQKLLFKKYVKNHKINFFFFNKVEEKKITEEELIPLNGLNIYIYIYIYIGACITFIAFMINLTNLEINYQRLSLSLSWTC